MTFVLVLRPDQPRDDEETQSPHPCVCGFDAHGRRIEEPATQASPPCAFDCCDDETQLPSAQQGHAAFDQLPSPPRETPDTLKRERDNDDTDSTYSDRGLDNRDRSPGADSDEESAPHYGGSISPLPQRFHEVFDLTGVDDDGDADALQPTEPATLTPGTSVGVVDHCDVYGVPEKYARYVDARTPREKQIARIRLLAALNDEMMNVVYAHHPSKRHHGSD